MESVAERAIRCFEALTGLTVVVHDLVHGFWRELAPERFHHRQAACRQVKGARFDRHCREFEITAFRAEAGTWREGRFHRCHAGLVELAQPVFDRDTFLFVLFAGPFRVDGSVHLDLSMPSSGARPDTDGLPRVTAGHVPVFREQLRQLGARLRCDLADRAPVPSFRDLPRREQILHFLKTHYAEPIRLADLARQLHLSPDRTRHLVVERCGTRFTRLLRQIRLQAACGLLLNTSLSVGSVAAQCGIPDLAAFNRAFRREYGIPPDDGASARADRRPAGKMRR